VITVRIAHAEPGPGRPADTGPRIDPRVPAVARLLGFGVVLADDAGHRALRAWLARDPDDTVLASASAEPRGPAMLAQTIFADDYRGAAVTFGGEIRAEDVAGRAALRLEILRKGWRIEADRRVERTVDVTGSQDWSRREITVTVRADTDVIRFGITLAGRGRVWLRNPELRREYPQDAGSAGVA
jgi:hypothetical protein